MSRSLLPDVKMGTHHYKSIDRRYVDSYGTIVAPNGDSPVIVKSIDTTPRGSRASSLTSNNDNTTSLVVLANSSIPGATLNLTNGIVGAGIVGLPFALSQGGFIFGVSALLLVSYLTHYTVTLMVETGRAHGRFSYEELCEQGFGTVGFYGLSFFQFFNSFGACIVYMLVISTTVPPVTMKYFSHLWWGFENTTVVTVCICTVILLPLSLYRNMSHLEKWSFLSLCSVLAMCCCLTYVFWTEENMSAYVTENQTWLLYEIHDEWAPSIGVLAFAFGCQQYSFFVFSTLEEPTRSRWWWVVCLGSCSALLLSLVIGIFGYLRYGTKSMPNILDNLDSTHVLSDVIRLVLALTMCLTFPLDFFVVRYTVQRFVQRCRCTHRFGGWCCRNEWDEEDDEHGNHQRSNSGTLIFSPVITRRNLKGRGHASDLSTCYHFTFTFFLWCVCLCCCILAIRSGGKSAGLGLVISLTGSIGTIFTAFVFPTATFLRLGTNDSLRPEQTMFCCCLTPNMYRVFRYLFAWFVLIFGLCSGVVGTFVTIQNAIVGGGNGTKSVTHG